MHGQILRQMGPAYLRIHAKIGRVRTRSRIHMLVVQRKSMPSGRTEGFQLGAMEIGMCIVSSRRSTSSKNLPAPEFHRSKDTTRLNTELCRDHSHKPLSPCFKRPAEVLDRQRILEREAMAEAVSSIFPD